MNVLNEWLNEAMKIDNLNVNKIKTYDSRSIDNIKNNEELNYFSYLSMKWEEYVGRIKIEVEKGRFEVVEGVSKGTVEEEKQGVYMYCYIYL